MCVLILSTVLSETFLILSRFERDMITTVYRSSCKVPVILVTFNFLDRFSKKYRNIKFQENPSSVKPNSSMRTDGRTRVGGSVKTQLS